MGEHVTAGDGYARGLIEASLDPLVTISPGGKIMDVNSATEQVTGVPREELIGSDFSDYFTEPGRARAGYEQVFSRGRVTDYPLAIRHVSGRITDVLYNATVYHGEDGQIAGVFAAARDVTRLRASQRELERANREIVTLGRMIDLLQSCRTIEEAFPIVTATLRDLLPGSSGAAYLLSDNEVQCERVTQWGRSIGESVFEPDECWALRRGHLHTYRLRDEISPRCPHVPEDRPYICAPLLAQGKAVGVLYLELAGAEECDGAPEVRLRLVQSATDSISLALVNLRLRQSLQSLAIRDPLTGLFNRRLMGETLERELSRARRKDTPLAVAMIDIDDFKEFNDRHGHVAGDQVLQSLAAELTRFRRAGDFACRYGGEEFLLILPDVELSSAVTRLEELRREVASGSKEVSGSDAPVTCSIGVAGYPDHATTPVDLIDAADKALYLAKAQGRDCLVVAQRSEPAAVERQIDVRMPTL